MPIAQPYWKQVASFPNYEVSQDGRVRNRNTGREIATFVGNNTSVMVNLWKNNRGHFKQVHRVLAETFIGPVDGLTVNHKNGIREDNRLENLEIITQAENNLHKINVLGKGRGESVNFAKLKEEDVLEIRRLRADGCMVKKLSQMFGVHRDQIRNICNRTHWRHI